MLPSPPAPRVVLVLGMHRSGTSALSHAVTLLGATPAATLMPPAADNPRGFWESSVLAALNDRILAQGGSRWIAAQNAAGNTTVQPTLEKNANGR